MSKELIHTNQLYRTVFGTTEGKEVLADIMNDCGYFSLEDITDPSDVARLNVARRILGKCGIWEPFYIRDITGITVEERTPRGLLKRLFKLPIPAREGDN